MKTDIEIANEFEKLPIEKIAKEYGICPDDLEFYGKYKAKLGGFSGSEKNGKVVLVTAINPTPLGEGKTTISIGLADALKKTGRNVALALREPSLGPVFGIKGGATGGGFSQVVPMEDINLHFCGDMHAISAANNLLSALIDNHLNFGNDLRLAEIKHKRCLDLNDRCLRSVIVGTGGEKDGVTRRDGFVITAASEVMAILCLAKDLEDLKTRLGGILVGFNFDGGPVYARDLQAQDAMAILLKDAIKPNLVQSMGGVLSFIHGGPFANIAHGCNTIIATKTAMKIADIVVTEAGFGADLGAEKFLDVKCRSADIFPSAVVIVATVKALKYNGGVPANEIKFENLSAVSQGICNLKKHIENMQHVYGLQAIVAINRFESDTQSEIDFIKNYCQNLNVKAFDTTVFLKGGEGAVELANEVADIVAKNTPEPKFAYDMQDSIEQKLNNVVQKIYGGSGVVFSDKAKQELAKIEKILPHLPVIIAKTQYSLSDNPKLLGRPEGFTVQIRDLELRSGAGFIVAIAGEIMLLPGLAKIPAACRMKIAGEGKIEGLF